MCPAQPDEVLELDELWRFVFMRARKRWVWLALCRRTRQSVAYAIGARDEHTCHRLWERIPKPYRQGRCYTDFWEAYAKQIPPAQQCPSAKSTGQTNHLERFNNTLRQRLARWVRKTLSFSKTEQMHEVCLLLFLHRYNKECALILD